MNRRRLITLTPAFVIVGCSSLTTTPSPPSPLQTDVTLIDQGLANIVVLLRGLPDGQRPSDATLAQIQTYVDALHANVDTIGTAVAPNQTTIEQISSIVTAVAGIATPFFPASPFIGMAIQAALALLPGILSMVGRTPPAAAAAASRKLTPGQARGILKAAAAK